MAKANKQASREAQAKALAGLATKKTITQAMPILSAIVEQDLTPEAAESPQGESKAPGPQEEAAAVPIQSVSQDEAPQEMVTRYYTRKEVAEVFAVPAKLISADFAPNRGRFQTGADYLNAKAASLGLGMATASPDTLLVKKLDPRATIPTVAYPGEDLGYDLYAIGLTRLYVGETKAISTGVAASQAGHGLLIRDRSSVANKGLTVSAGVIDAGYRGELKVLITNHRHDPYIIQNGDKIAQMIPLPVLTGSVQEVSELPKSNRSECGFGSSGK